MTDGPGLRERKKEATRAALGAAALRLALERGPGNVRVDDIAEAAGVSPRTYNNYFSSREQAIVAAVTAHRAARTAAAVVARAPEVELADAVTDAVAGEYGAAVDDEAAMLMITSTPALRASYVNEVTTVEDPLTDAIIERHPGTDRHTAEVLAAAVGAATRLALRRWLSATESPPSMPGFVIPSGDLAARIRTALSPLAPALNAVSPPAP